VMSMYLVTIACVILMFAGAAGIAWSANLAFFGRKLWVRLFGWTFLIHLMAGLLTLTTIN
jgi:hypothetical protein